MIGAAGEQGSASTLSGLLILPLYAATLCLSAVLAFSVQPMFAKMVLPLLGGAPSVWNTAMVFFQATLLAGYAYAHLISRRLRAGPQLAVHATLLIAAFAILPLAVPAGSAPPPGDSPVAWLLELLARSVALPFLALSATAPLLQHWLSETRHPAARDPYFLYTASNIGSLVGLLGYPLVLEPWLTTGQQTLAWTAGFGALVLTVCACAVARWRFRRPAAVIADGHAPAAVDATLAADPTVRDRLWWVGLAFVPSSLLLGVTTHITTDLASVPLLWVIPLALYLVTFIITFARRPALRHSWMVAAQPFPIMIIALLAYADVPADRMLTTLALHLVGFFLTAMVCHGELARRRPSTRHLTEFYLWISVGGVLGGMFNALLAPVIFTSTYEYPLALVLACLLRPATAPAPRRWWLDFLWPALIAAYVLLASRAVGLLSDTLPPTAGPLLFTVLFVFPVMLALSASDTRPARFGLGIAAVLALSPLLLAPAALHAERSFFGVSKVQTDGYVVELYHGTTLHGAAFADPERRLEPLTYYHRQGPYGEFFAARPVHGDERVGVAGLGAGTLACYARPGQAWTFYEIDPAVVRIARDTRYFHYMSECGASARVVLGDARLSLTAAPDGEFDVLVMDAFSSDAIPVHLLTREAVRLYLRKMAPDGVILFNITNWYFDLVPILASLAAEDGLAIRYRSFSPTDADEMAYSTEIVAIARHEEALAFLGSMPGWRGWERPAVPAAARAWSDDYSNILGAMRWGS